MNKKTKELFFQVVAHLVVFLFYSLEKENASIEGYEIANFLNYSFIAFSINYFLLPWFYRSKNTTLFILLVVVAIFTSSIIEEYVIEKIFFTGNRADKILMFFASIDIIPIVCVLVGLKFAWDAFMKQSEVERLNNLVEESELQFLKSQINPHFLFNNLNNLYSYALEKSPKTPEIILELSSLLRYMLYECSAKHVSLQKEIEHLENFIKLNTLQVEDRGTINTAFNKPTLNYQIAPLVLIVFIENAFKHSQNSQSKDIIIDINLHVNESGVLFFSCINSFDDVDNRENQLAGIGLENVKKRLSLLYPDQHSLNISNENNRFKVDLTLQLI